MGDKHLQTLVAFKVRSDALQTMPKNIILAFDGSSEGLNALLSAEKWTSWKDDRLFLVFIIPRPVQSCVYEPDFFNPSISVEAFEAIQIRAHEACDHLLRHGFNATVKMAYADSRATVTQFLRDMNPDLLVTTRCAHKRLRSSWGKESFASYAVDVSPCAILML